jgi:hypothetical protein
MENKTTRDEYKKYLIIIVVIVVIILCLIIKPLQYLPDPEGDAERATLQAGRDTLIADYQGTDEDLRVAAFKALRHDESLWPFLIQGLQENGTPELALAFCQTYEPELENEAVKWADEHGYQIFNHRRGMDNWFTIEPKEDAP